MKVKNLKKKPTRAIRLQYESQHKNNRYARKKRKRKRAKQIIAEEF